MTSITELDDIINRTGIHSNAASYNPEALQALARELRELRLSMRSEEPQDICGLCGQLGADKIPHPEHWPGEQIPDTELVHAECECHECARAHAALSDSQRESFLRSL